ncbi:MAG TPA: hypothetical protein DCQ78_06995 [Ruminococcus sp.]|nr:hypothetical protein [Ruminococcus sp.]
MLVYNIIRFRKCKLPEQVFIIKVERFTPTLNRKIPNNPYIIAKNVPHPGAFFVFGDGAAAIIVTAKIYVAEK